MKILCRIILLLLVSVGFIRAADGIRRIELPAETAVFKPAELPGYALVNATCLTCHSVEYVKYQPSSSPRTYWQATVIKMQKTFGAPIPDAMVEPLVDYLVRNLSVRIEDRAERGTLFLFREALFNKVVNGVKPLLSIYHDELVSLLFVQEHLRDREAEN